MGLCHKRIHHVCKPLRAITICSDERRPWSAADEAVGRRVVTIFQNGVRNIDKGVAI
jgi:hypothetical protein